MKEKVFATLDNVKKHHLDLIKLAYSENPNDYEGIYRDMKVYILSLFLELRIELAKALMEENHDA